MPSKITSSVKGLVKEPIETVKKGMKTAIKPATSEGTGAVFVGAVLSAPIGYLYAKGFEMLSAQFPDMLKTPIVSKVIQFGLPLLPIYFVKRFNVPFGNLINGTLLGIFVMQIVMEIYGMIKGTGTKETVTQPGAVVVHGTGYAEWFK